MQVLANYTWGKVMDDQSSLSEGKYQDMFNIRADWSRSSYDIKHAFKIGYVYDLPFGKGRTFGAGWNGITDGIFGGWALEGIVQLQSGTASNVRTGTDRANVGKTNERPNVIRNPNLPARSAHGGPLVRHLGVRDARLLHVGQRGRIHGGRRWPDHLRPLI